MTEVRDSQVSQGHSQNEVLVEKQYTKSLPMPIYDGESSMPGVMVLSDLQSSLTGPSLKLLRETLMEVWDQYLDSVVFGRQKQSRWSGYLKDCSTGEPWELSVDLQVSVRLSSLSDSQKQSASERTSSLGDSPVDGRRQSSI